MYSKDGENYFIVDAHLHMWDGSDENQKNVHGAQFIECFYDYHKNLSPEEYVWTLEKYKKYSEEQFMTDIFDNGYADHAIFNPAALNDFYVNGFSRPLAWDMAQRNPDRLTYNHNFDPRNGEVGLRQLEEDAEKYHLKGVKLYTAEWHGDSRGYKLSDPWAYTYLEKCQELGITNIHVHKGPTIKPLDRDAFDVSDIDHCATDFPDLNFIVEHVGLPRLEDFCWIATQESNVYGGLAVAIPFIHTRPRYWAQIIGELLYWIGEDRILFSSDYALWQPKWLIEKFVDFQIPEDMQGEYKPITTDQRKKILGLNAVSLYPHIKVPEGLQLREPAMASSSSVSSSSAGPIGSE